MSQTEFPLLTLITFFPLLGAAILLFVDKEKKETLRWITLIVTFLEFIFSLPLFFQFRLDTPAMQFVEKSPWIPEYGVSYFLGIDGISLFLVLLTTFLTLVSVISCWQDIQDKVREFMICILFLETGMIGVFVALDLFLFYVFWELMLIPMYLLIGVWGNPKRRIYAAARRSCPPEGTRHQWRSHG